MTYLLVSQITDAQLFKCLLLSLFSAAIATMFFLVFITVAIFL